MEGFVSRDRWGENGFLSGGLGPESPDKAGYKTQRTRTRTAKDGIQWAWDHGW